MTNLFSLISAACEGALKPLPEKELRLRVEETFPELRHISSASSLEEREKVLRQLESRLRAERIAAEQS